MRSLVWLVMLAALGLAAGAGPRDGPIAAIVVEVKGVALMKDPEGPESRRGTQLKLLQPIHESRTLVVDPQGKLVLSFASSARRVTLTGPVTVVVRAGAVEVTSGSPANLSQSVPKGRQAVLAPKDRMDFSRMGGVSARALGNVRTDQARPALSLEVVRQDQSTFAISPGEVRDVVYLVLENPDSTAPLAQQEWARGKVRGAEGDRIVPDWDLAAGQACFLQLDTRAPEWIPEEKRYGRTDFWVYRYPSPVLAELQQGAQVADEPGADRVWRQLQLSSLYRSYHLYDRAIERVARLVEGHPDPEMQSLLRELRSEKLEAERSVGG